MPNDQTQARPKGPGEANPAKLDPFFAQALGALRYGLYFLTTGGFSGPRGMLVSWVGQVSGRPPLVQVAVRENRPLLPDLQDARAFALNILPAGDDKLLADLTRPAASRFAGIELQEGPLGLPLLAAGPGALCCRVRETRQPGDHMLFLGQVEGAVWRGGGPSLEAGHGGHAYLGLS